MKYIFIIFFICLSLFSKSLYLSDIPLPKTVLINTFINGCDENCLKETLKEGKIFSFLALYKSDIGDKNITNLYNNLSTLLNIKATFFKKDVSIALLVPKKIIGRYTNSTTSSILSYLLLKSDNFKLEVFNCKNETKPLIEKSIREIEQKGYRYVIAPFTANGIKKLLDIDTNLIFYIPTVNKKEIENTKPNYIFGGIDYQEQIDRLLTLTNDKVAIFYDQSFMGNKLSYYVRHSGQNVVYEKSIPSYMTKFKSILRRNKRLQNSSIFLNTPLVKSALISSQLRFYQINPYALFSTQISYNPLLLNLTQYADIKNLYIANSINYHDREISTINTLLGNDIEYDWINYSTSIGIDYLFCHFLNKSIKRVFPQHILNNQVLYDTEIVKPTRSGFKVEISNSFKNIMKSKNDIFK